MTAEDILTMFVHADNADGMTFEIVTLITEKQAIRVNIETASGFNQSRIYTFNPLHLRSTETARQWVQAAVNACAMQREPSRLRDERKVV